MDIMLTRLCICTISINRNKTYCITIKRNNYEINHINLKIIISIDNT